MLQVILHFLLISFICVVWGMPGFLYFAYKKNTSSLNTQNILLSFFVGLVLISIVSSWASLFFPVTIGILLLLTVPILILDIHFQKRVQRNVASISIKNVKPLEIIFGFSCVALFSFLATGEPTMEDSELYHIQTIRWIHDYGTVPGLANLYLRYGLYSNWFHAVSIFQLPWANQNFVYINHAFTVWLFLFLFHHYKSYAETKSKVGAHLSLFFLCTILFMLIEWDLFRVAASSTSYDFVVTGLSLICIQLLLKKILLNEQSIEEKNVLIVLIISAPFFKLTGFLILPFLIFLWLYSKDKPAIFIKSLVIGLVALMPFLIKNVIQTGYPLFPYSLGAVFETAWKVPKEMVFNFNKYIYLGNHHINRAIPESAWIDNSSFSYYSDWFLHLVAYDKIIMVSSLLSLPISIMALKKVYGNKLKPLLAFYSVCVIALFVWLMESPDLRFCFGLILFIVFFPITGLITSHVKPWMISAAMIAFIVGIGYYICLKGSASFTSENLLFVKSVDVPPFRKESINQHTFNIPEKINNNWNSRCLDCPLPCIYQVNPYLKLRGDEINNGFQMKPYPDSTFIKNYRY